MFRSFCLFVCSSLFAKCISFTGLSLYESQSDFIAIVFIKIISVLQNSFSHCNGAGENAKINFRKTTIQKKFTKKSTSVTAITNH